jgi:hypothetical protein
MNWVYLTQDRDRRWVIVNMLMYFLLREVHGLC